MNERDEPEVPGPDDEPRNGINAEFVNRDDTTVNGQFGAVYGGVHFHARDSGVPPARSVYLELVRRIAPPDSPGLIGRDAELAELARFCRASQGPSYMWWRAGPWAGKPALLSSFVLRPPAEVAERVRIVSFFATSRLATQDTREVFTQVLLEQLAAGLGQSLPPMLPANRESYLLDLMSQAAEACQKEGRRLLLVVDGLDEDRRTGGEPSIAGLLPAEPPAGMRVIVASRLVPPLPDDVPKRHPLRDPANIRPLDASPYAEDIERKAKNELRRLLGGTAAERDMIGLLTAARDGLTEQDLVELGRLADVDQWETERILQAVTGRALTSRPSLYAPAAGPAVYLPPRPVPRAAALLGRRLAPAGGRPRHRNTCWSATTRCSTKPVTCPG